VSRPAQRILVTGAAVGIGQGIAVELARGGAAVAVHSARSDPAETLRLAGRAAIPVRGDLSRIEDCRRVVDAAAEALGGLDGLVNNAGVTRELPFAETDPDAFAELFDSTCAAASTARSERWRTSTGRPRS
jgi:glucose 1-dehydrogenase